MNKDQAKQKAQSSGERPAAGFASRRRIARFLLFLVVCCGVLGALWIGRADGRSAGSSKSSSPTPSPARGQNVVETGVFSPAHSSLVQAVGDFLDIYPTPVQPIAFNHKIHIEKGLQCTSCHSGVTQGPNAGIPSVTFCMACHQVIARDNPEIKKLAAYAAKGQEPPWQPVNWFYPSAHVRFWHAPHIRAGVDCSTCHGDIAQETVAVRKKNLTMNFCLTGCGKIDLGGCFPLLSA
jgi:hypothetical protein